MDAKMMEKANLGIVVVKVVVNLHLVKMLRETKKTFRACLCHVLGHPCHAST